jgi:hypothetical protein
MTEWPERMHFYVATYGDFGIEIEFFKLDQDAEYRAAVDAAEKGHREGEYDTFTHGEIT